MSPETDLSGDYDVIVIGARPAGAGTALLLARLGLRVLVLDRGQYGADTLSTHALMRGGVLQLARWNVLPRVIAAGTPAVKAATFIYGDDIVRVPVKSRDGIDGLYAPRRTVLDRAIANTAMEAGVAFAYGATLVDLLWTHDGRVRGIVAQIGSGTARLGAGLVVGADGLRSLVARLVGATATRTGSSSAANVFGYWSGVPVDGYRWYYRAGAERRRHPHQRRADVHLRVGTDKPFQRRSFAATSIAAIVRCCRKWRPTSPSGCRRRRSSAA